ncbi:Spermidine/putrescine transport system permease protein PotB [Nocardioides dokdonensis FR1436]|uniref:Spermidine/putrescine transport system permease protein PotB n=1 Tax=Nocardioides dokdonensis FR1436 TaxID=1300347 RepID=A0A1A9GKQ9_9ACTN|nr:ABC transporter permease [Nocardioides dokdonensis]ANH38242.1 Spermidine/putrescine transport system permease protein PotB [Nocardioides dokdonensis FR1436]
MSLAAPERPVEQPPARPPEPRSRRWSLRGLADGWGLLVLPLAAFLVLVLVVPLGMILARSFTDPDLGLGNYQSFFGSGVYLDVLVNTFVTAISVTLICLAIGYPYAYLMTIAPAFWRTTLLILVLVPFWTSLLVRSFALLLLLRDTGAVNETLISWGLIDSPISMVRNFTGVLIGMVQVLLPFMVLPLYATMRGIDRRLLEAGESLGARPAFAFWRIFVPLSIPGIAAGGLLVFIQSLGFYITPALLGGPSDVMLGELIVQQVSTVLRWGFAAALATVLLLTTFALLAVVSRFVNVRAMFWKES